MEDLPEPPDLREQEAVCERAKAKRAKRVRKRAIISSLCGLAFISAIVFSEIAREFIKRHPGLLLVFAGVAIEVYFDWKEMHGHLSWLKKTAALMLVFGLAVEFWEAAELDIETSKANERAALLQLKVAQLEAKTRWRTITSEQRKAFVALTTNLFKFPIRVRMAMGSDVRRSTKISFGEDPWGNLSPDPVRENIPVKRFNEVDSFVMQVRPLASNIVVESGEVVLVVNDLKWIFDIPPQRPKWGLITMQIARNKDGKTENKVLRVPVRDFVIPPRFPESWYDGK